MKVVSIVGARPQLVKLGAVAKAFAGTAHRHVVVHTGQHYDAELSDVFFTEFGIPEPDFHLGIGSGGHGAQTGAMLAAIDPILDAERPDWVLVYGDTNSTIAGALSAVKQHLPVAHLEAGLRSFNRRMPEEHNRVLTDHCADLLLAPTAEAVAALGERGPGRPRRQRRRRDGRRVLPHARRGAGRRRAPRTARRDRPRAAVPRGDPAPGREHRRPRAARRAHRIACGPAGPGGAPGPPAPAGQGRPVRAQAEPGRARRGQAAAVPPARGRGARLGGRGHRLGRPPEGGVPARPRLHHAAHRDRMGRDPRRRLERARGAARPAAEGRVARDRHPPGPRRRGSASPTGTAGPEPPWCARSRSTRTDRYDGRVSFRGTP